MTYPTDEQEARQALIRQGICPNCGGKLDEAKLARNFISAWRGKARQCYECLDTFYVEPREE